MKYSWFFAIIGGLFFASCGGDSGTTDSGFRYEFHDKKEGATPQVGEYAYFHVYMKNPKTGEMTVDTRKNPVVPSVAIPDEASRLKGQQAVPVYDVLPMMSIGDSLSVYQSLDSIPRKPPGFEDEKELAYQVVLMDIKSAEAYKEDQSVVQKEMQEAQAALATVSAEVGAKVQETAKDYMAGKLNDQIKTTESGLKYLIHEEGTGPVAKTGEPVTAEYFGALTNGTRFDDSFGRVQPFTFPVGQGRVIPGWDEGFGMLKEGTKATLFIPAALGYGASGSGQAIPPNSELIFYVEVEKVGN
ncbi:MAG: FKBP-type peptidyl-prolyl cis-trans isomerase FkpA [Paraglaciecola sp.]|jgi:FKBP-type peptidyl-prolyl cis-trans isomerase FkpA